MDTFNIAGNIQTVSGLIEPGELGMTLTHEHMLIDLSSVHGPPVDPEEKTIYYSELNEKTLGMIRHHHMSNAENYRLNNIGTAVEEVMLYKNHGGGTLVDATSEGIGRNPKGLLEISVSTGVNIIMGSGFYVQSSHPTFVNEETSRDLSQRIIEDIVVGASGSTIKSGVIGEIGCSWPITDSERKVIEAAVIAQRVTGASILIHPGRHEKSPTQILEIMSDLGADLTNTIIGHLDRTVFEETTLDQIGQRGCYFEWDLFGNESSFYRLNPEINHPNDGTKVDRISWLISQGFEEKILISQDICSRHRLLNYGGHGYFYILSHIIPLMRNKGFEEKSIENILVNNPARALTFQEPIRAT